MSLSKRYRLRCDLSELLMDRVMSAVANNDEYPSALEASRDDRHAQQAGCKHFSVVEDDARRARRAALAEGWVRHTEERPIYAGADTMTAITYDICAGCAPHLPRE